MHAMLISWLGVGSTRRVHGSCWQRRPFPALSQTGFHLSQKLSLRIGRVSQAKCAGGWAVILKNYANVCTVCSRKKHFFYFSCCFSLSHLSPTISGTVALLILQIQAKWQTSWERGKAWKGPHHQHLPWTLPVNTTQVFFPQQGFCPC